MKFLFWVFPILFYMTVVHSGDAYVGQIVIDGQVISGTSNVIKGSGVKHTIERAVKSFSSVTVDGGFDINYQHGSPLLTITGDDNIIEHVISSVTHNTLRLSTDKSYSASYPIVIDVFSQRLQEMSLDGTSTVKLNDIKTDQLTLNISGTVDVMATGKADALKLTLQGTGDVMVRQLDSDIVTVELDGTSNVEVTAHKKLDANITGVGNILYFGSPQKVSKQVSGVGDIEPAE